MSATLIMPCAGKSSRFNNSRPKYLLTHPNGNLMLIEAINGLNLTSITNIIITVVKEHIEINKVNLDKIKDKIFELKGIRPDFLILDEFTTSQSDTVYKTIQIKNIEGSIFIKDCDNYFDVEISNKNLVCISTLQNGTNAINKSYVSLNKYGYLSGIVEKQVISDKFCVGGYSFKDAITFKKNFEELMNLKSINQGEIYISHVVQKMLLNQETFEVAQVENYSDWGTIDDWKKYTSQFKTIFIDLDGTLVINSSEYFEPVWGESPGLLNNIAIINSFYDQGKTKIIITTSRKETPETLNQLKKLGIKYHQIIFNLPHAQRVLINDYSDTNPYPSAVAVCLARNEDNLKDLI